MFYSRFSNLREKIFSAPFFTTRSFCFLSKVLAILIISFLLFEVGLRLVNNYDRKVKYFLYSTRYDLDLKKIKTTKDLVNSSPCPLRPFTNINGFIVNSDGFYTPNYELTKRENTIRIGFIGDSFLVGVVPYKDNFVNVFANLLDHSGGKVEVVNWGLPCLGPKYEEKILEVEGFKSSPDYLVWMFFIGNDFTDEAVEGEKLPLPNLLTKNFLTLRLFRNLSKSFSGMQLNREVKTDSKVYSQGGIYIGGGDYDPNKPTLEKDQYLRIESEKLNLFSSLNFPYQALYDVQKTLLAFKNNCDSRGIKCLIVLIPDEVQVDTALADEVIANRTNPSDLEIDFPQKALIQFFKENNFMYLDLLPLFKENDDNKKLYQPFDTHWNVEGNRLAAEAVSNFFSKIFFRF